MSSNTPAKILFFGDIFGKPGRHAVARVLPLLREQYNPDLVIINAENLAHGKGVTDKTLAEMTAMGVDVFTSGNHIFDKDGVNASFAQYKNLIRPLNYTGVSGEGFVRIEKYGKKFLIANIGGRVFFENQYDGIIANPFLVMDELLTQKQDDEIVFVDFHAEATSEKNAMGYYLDGRVSAIVGTHTHVPTADAKVLPKGTAYVTDVGFCGPQVSIIGADVESTLETFLGKREKFRMEVSEDKNVDINAVLVTIEKGMNSIMRINQVVSI